MYTCLFNIVACQRGGGGGFSSAGHQWGEGGGVFDMEMGEGGLVCFQNREGAPHI